MRMLRACQRSSRSAELHERDFAPVSETCVETPVEHHCGSAAGHAVQAFNARIRAWRSARSRAAPGLPSSIQDFRTLIFGSSISMLGTRISTLAFPMLVLGIKNSPLMAGLVAFAALVPGVLLYMPAGVIVDRRDPRRVMLVSEISRGAVATLVVIALVIYRQHISIVFLLVAMLAEEVLEIFSTLADRRYLNRLMEQDSFSEISSRHASAEARTHAAALAGRPIVPLLFEFGPFLPFLADAISFVASVGSLLWIRPAEEPQKAEWPTFKQLTSGIGDGIGEVKNDRRIWLTSLLMAMTSLVSQALILIFLVEAHSNKFSALRIGIVLGASGVGGAVGSFWSATLLPSIRKYWLPMQMGVWLIVFLVLATTRNNVVSVSAGAMFFMSVTGAIGNVESRSYLTENIADDMIGKVSGISCTMAIGACALGPAVGGYTVQYYHTKVALHVLLVIVAVMALVSLFVFKKSDPGNPASMPLPDAYLPVGQQESPDPARILNGSSSQNDEGVENGGRGIAPVSAEILCDNN